jgi:hypothetical protein
MRRIENPKRVERLMRSAISRLNLDLREIAVLTEAASGNFVVTPLLAALAGASHVVALAADSPYGAAREVADYLVGWASDLGVADRIDVTTDRGRAAAASCSLVTNLGFVRPIDESIVRYLPEDAVIALMWEPWEFRPEDIDVVACRRRRIPVLGTCETDPRVGTFRYVGLVVLKLLLETDIEIFGSELLVIGSSPFLESTVEVLQQTGASVSVVAMDDNALRRDSADLGVEKYDAIVLVDHRSRKELIGRDGLFTPDQLALASAQLVHVCGGVDDDGLKRAGVAKVPSKAVAPGVMTVTTDYVGPRPVVDLHAAGLKVGEIFIRSLRGGSTRSIAANEAVKSGLALDFDPPTYRA